MSMASCLGTRKSWAGRLGHAECSIARLSILTVYIELRFRSSHISQLVSQLQLVPYDEHGVVGSV
jgi:hypothetical protein